MKIIGIAGSMNPDSTTKKAVKIALDSARKAGAQVELIHLAEWPMPIYDVRDDETTYPSIVHQFVNKISEADGLIIASPEYHGTISGALKNALDFLSARQLKDKPVAVLGVAAGSLGATNTVNTLHLIMRNLHAWALPSSPSVPTAYSAFDSDGKLKDARLQERVEMLGMQLVHTIDIMKGAKPVN
ncbi:NAD(P)H-dependent oxidoreductase [Brevibacillus ruminantium]|uniref:NAD(P)H-dependent oxidoreductase n=1 Tax=Brevibacillus ruminantium TaxID=2950604 RepID=A0ABY4W9G6_9BACL|nr:NAD(P)H-dependent oxidoreductase [Brevibacillus ruminantium]USG63667.1 NAD(P)H-dependent oxidoreductase [Brevibacillus ruminantium]